MKITERVNALLNEQVKNEIFSAHIYFSAANWCKVNKFNGAADWLYKHAKEELKHSQAFMEFTTEFGGCIEMMPIPAPEVKFKGIREIFKLIAAHEDRVTGQIHKIAEVCLEEKEQGVYTFIQKYVAEQLEEMATARLNLDYLDLLPDSNLFLFDDKLADYGE